jgi:hypothetical protein
MEKYGILREYLCEACGYRIITRDGQEYTLMVKAAGDPEEGHVHNLKEVTDGPRSDKSPDVRPE